VKKPLITVLALLICLGAVLIALAFGYSRYKAAKARDAAFGAILQNYAAPAPASGSAATSGAAAANGSEVVSQALTGRASNAALSVQMPPQLSRAPHPSEQRAEAEDDHSPTPR